MLKEEKHAWLVKFSPHPQSFVFAIVMVLLSVVRHALELKKLSKNDSICSRPSMQ